MLQSPQKLARIKQFIRWGPLGLVLFVPGFYYAPLITSLCGIGLLSVPAFLWYKNYPVSPFQSSARNSSCPPTAIIEGHDYNRTISASAFYAQYHGHPIDDVVALHHSLRQQGKKIVWLIGDSSLDNKHWLYGASKFSKRYNPLDDPSYTGPLSNGYEQVVQPARGVKDVCYWLNDALQRKADERADQKPSEYACINCAVEESTLSDRDESLLHHDIFVRDHMQPDDIVIVSVGGNDIALRPNLRTLMAISFLVFYTPSFLLRTGAAPGLGHLRNLLRYQEGEYLRQICAKTKPKMIIPCMIYFPCETGHGWVDLLLNTLGYNDDPRKVQEVIRTVYRECTSKIEVPGVKNIRPIGLFDVMDAKDPKDYDNRVEPSVAGGRKMAEAFAQLIDQTE